MSGAQALRALGTSCGDPLGKPIKDKPVALPMSHVGRFANRHNPLAAKTASAKDVIEIALFRQDWIVHRQVARKHE